MVCCQEGRGEGRCLHGFLGLDVVVGGGGGGGVKARVDDVKAQLAV